MKPAASDHSAHADYDATRALEEAVRHARRSEEWLLLALEMGRLGIYELDFATGVHFFSDRYARIHGYESGRAHGTFGHWLLEHQHWIHRDDTAVLDEVRQEVNERGRDHYDVEFRKYTRAGDYKVVRSVGRVLERAPQGRPLRVIGTLEDITERLQLAQELREARRCLSEASRRREGEFQCENKRIAPEAHDEVERRLSAMRAQLDLLQSELPADAAPQRTTRRLRSLIDETMELMRHMVTDRRAAVSGKTLPPAADGALAHILSARERQVLTLIVAGHRLDEIADRLRVSAKTVSTHKMRVMRKLKVSNNAELIRYTTQHDLGLSQPI